MFISHKWLQNYVDVDKRDLYEHFSIYTAEVEGVEEKGRLDHVVVGHVRKVEKHPDADKLNVAQVDTGDKKPRQIVCGAKNLEEGQLVAVALPGATLGEDFTIKEAELRGVLSQGMICSEDELGLVTERQPGIMVLDKNLIPGTPLAEALALEDTIFEIENKSITNRPDLFGHYGLARECSVIYNTPLKPYTNGNLENNTGLPKLDITIEDKQACRRYMAISIDNISPKPSPHWLKQALEYVGLRSINSIVDITNYIMMDLGQPLHAFDADTLKSKKIRVGYSKHKEEQVTTLMGDDVLVQKHHLLIKDHHTPIAIAGVMGLGNSEVSETTTSIILEAATFDGSSVRKTSNELGIKTDSSTRFEKRLDPEFAQIGLEKAVLLLLELHPEAKVSSQITDHYVSPYDEVTIDCTYSMIIDRIGEQVTKHHVQDLLERLGFQLTDLNDDEFRALVPSWRATGDVSLPEDLVEEVARMYGFNKLEGKHPLFPLTSEVTLPYLSYQEELRNTLAKAHNLYEVLNYSFYSKAMHEGCLLTSDLHADPIALLNPLSLEHEIMRTSMVPHLVTAVRKNQQYMKPFGAFELGRIYPKRHGKIFDEQNRDSYEEYALGMVMSHPNVDDKTPLHTYHTHPFYALKAVIEDLIHRLHSTHHVSLERANAEELQRYPWAHPKKSLLLRIDGQTIGCLAELHPEAAHNMDVQHTTVCAEIAVTPLYKAQAECTLAPYADTPPVSRDLSFVIHEKQDAGPLLAFIKAHHEYITDVILKDIYQGEHLEEGKKSVTFGITFMHPEKTLTDKAINHITEGLVAHAKTSFNAELRS